MITEELDITSENFNPIAALYSVDFTVTKKPPRNYYQNLAALDNILLKNGLYSLNKQNIVKKVSNSTDSSKEIQRTAILSYSTRNTNEYLENHLHKQKFTSHMKSIEGPSKYLYNCCIAKERIRVITRSKRRKRGVIEGVILFFDKHWNLILTDVLEIWRVRKEKYAQNNYMGKPQDCSTLFQKIGVEIPSEQIQNVGRKNVEIRRHIKQLFVRGENIVLIHLVEKK